MLSLAATGPPANAGTNCRTVAAQGVPSSSSVPAVAAPTAASSPPRVVHTAAASADASPSPAHQPSSPPKAVNTASGPADVQSPPTVDVASPLSVPAVAAPTAASSSPTHPDVSPSSSVPVAATTTAAPSLTFVPAPDTEPLPLCVDIGIQAEGEYDPRSRVRRVVLAERETLPLRFVHLNGVEGVRDEQLLPQHAPDRVGINEQRRMCDCTTCVSHATNLMRSDQFAEVPSTPGIRLTPLSGLGLTHCSKGAATLLARGLQESREKTLVACACSTCSAHRGLLWAYRRAKKVRRMPRSPLAGTPPKRRRM